LVVDVQRRAKGHACVVVIYGPDLGRRATLGRTSFEIGRSSKCDLAIDQESVSRHHARITWTQGFHAIEDLGSTNGTFVGETRVKARLPLRHGDQIKVGRSILKYMAGDDLETNYHEEIYRLMTVDALTQTYNRRYFEEALERECNRCTRYKRDLSLIVFDIDHFKRINDAHGHVAGDGVLAQLASAVKQRLRAQDIFARQGGEEFAVLLPEVALVGARAVAEKIRRIVEGTSIQVGDEALHVTVSAGVATFGASTESPHALFKEADQRMYEAKSSGRNRVAG
jgi:diguanylate cyclase (GGDEF)-like protein